MRSKYFPTVNSIRIFAYVGLLVYLCYGLKYWRSQVAVDYYQYWVVGEAISSMQITDIYDLNTEKVVREEFFKHAQKRNLVHELRCLYFWRNLKLNQTPFLYGLVHLISTGNFENDYEHFRLLSLAMYFGSIIILCHLLGNSIPLTLVLSVFFTSFFWPFKYDLQFANVNGIQVGFLTLFIWIRSKKDNFFWNLTGGFLLGLSIALKPNVICSPALLLAFWLISRQFKLSLHESMGILCGMAIAVILPLAQFGGSCGWSQWLKAFPSNEFLDSYAGKNFLSFFFNALNSKFLGIIEIILCIIPAIFLWKRRKRYLRINGSTFKDNICLTTERLLIGLGILIYLISGPLILGHYFLLLTIPILILSGPIKEKLTTRPLFLSIIFMAVLIIDSHRVILNQDFTNSLNWYIFIFTGLITLYVAALLELFALSRVEATEKNNADPFPVNF